MKQWITGAVCALGLAFAGQASASVVTLNLAGSLTNAGGIGGTGAVVGPMGPQLAADFNLTPPLNWTGAFTFNATPDPGTSNYSLASYNLTVGSLNFTDFVTGSGISYVSSANDARIAIVGQGNYDPALAGTEQMVFGLDLYMSPGFDMATATAADFLTNTTSNVFGFNADPTVYPGSSINFSNWTTAGRGPALSSATMTGTFGAPTITAGVPEPATWALLIVGLGLTGVMLRYGRLRLDPLV